MKKLLNIFIILTFIYSCGIYSFSGASIPMDAKTVSVNYFSNIASIVQPSLSEITTEKLKDLCTEQTNLIIVEENADLKFSGAIINYEVKPISINANENAAKNRLTISIRVNYSNNIDNKNNFENIFTRFKDFESSQNLIDIEEVLIDEISNEIIEDIFNKAFVNW